MAVYIPVGAGIFAYRFRLVSDPEEMVVTMGFDASVGYTGGGNALANDLSSSWLTAFPATEMSNEYTFVGTTVRWGLSSGFLTVFENLRNVVGTFTGSPVPNNSAFLVTKRTAEAGRRGKGRWFLPPFAASETNVDARGVLAASTVTNTQTRLNTLLTSITSHCNPVILHNIPTDPPLFIDPTLVTSLVLSAQLATRRSRMRP